MRLIEVLRRARVSGSAAAMSSAIIAARRAVAEGSTAYAPINAMTHCLWPD